MTPIRPPLSGNQPDSVAEAYATYDALARASIDNPAVGHDPIMVQARKDAYERLLALSEGI